MAKLSMAEFAILGMEGPSLQSSALSNVVRA
jgi:hypothetical protein